MIQAQTLPLACFLSLIRPPGVAFENALLQITPVNKGKCPLVRDRSDVAFLLYTRHNPIEPQELVVDDDESLFASNIDFNAPTVVYFHAFMETPIEGSAIVVRQAYMLRGDTNFIMVDAQRLEAGPWYITAAQNTWYIGKFAAKFIDYLVSRGLDLSKTHLVGHSLGGQSAGVAGSSLTTGRVSRLTALDPALPLFDKLPNDQKLDQSDAEFIDVIHTDAGIFGYPTPVGHADFYPNGGISPQPGCELEVVLPQQLLLQKCEKNAQPKGFFEFQLKPHVPAINPNTNHFLNELEKFMTYIQGLKGENSVSDTKQDKKNIMFIKKKTKANSIAMSNEKNSKRDNKKDEDAKDVFKALDMEIDDQRPQIFTVRPDQELDLDNVGTTSEETTKDVRKAKVMNDIYNNVHLIINEQRNTEEQHNMESATIENLYDLKNVMTENVNIETPIHFESTKVISDTKTLLDDQVKRTDIKNAKSHVIKRQKRFINPFKRTEAEADENFLFKILNFVVSNRKSIIPVYTVVREINTLVKTGQGELNHSTKEKNNFIGAAPPLTTPTTYTLELGNESRLVAFARRLFGLAPKGDRLTIGTGKR